MRVLLLGATGKLGSRLAAALVAYGADVVALVRSQDKLRRVLRPELVARLLAVVEAADASDAATVEAALRSHACSALVCAAGNQGPPWKPQDGGGRLATAALAAAAAVGANSNSKPMRVWIVGGVVSLGYPGAPPGSVFSDYSPTVLTAYHQATAVAVSAVSTTDVEWSLLCASTMYGESNSDANVDGAVSLLAAPRGHKNLVVGADTAPAWDGGLLQRVPLVGNYLAVLPGLLSYMAKYEDVADVIAEDLASGRRDFVGKFVGYKDVGGGRGAAADPTGPSVEN
ncbi:hypothetical protein HK405_015776 [Cladochytrium tenue]|nr:hypothetical protein HK405_015776 [Cladochytrium tenue]